MTADNAAKAWKGLWKRRLRRYREVLLPGRNTIAYRQWMRKQRSLRTRAYGKAFPHGLFSIISAVWDGSPPKYLRALAKSIAEQNAEGAAEWVLLDNGCRNPNLLTTLSRLEEHGWIRIVRKEQNTGIALGMRAALEAATGRYILPVDADDELYPDALAIVAEALRSEDYPALLYSDEDKIDAGRISQPYFKPAWDPVLFANSAYIAHLAVMDRELALSLEVYSDANAEGSADWDAFVNFANAGYQPVHIPEVLYQWRIHPASTADDGAAKNYIARSQAAVLEKFLNNHKAGQRFVVEESTLFEASAHFRFRRKKENAVAMLMVIVGGDAGQRPPADYPMLTWETVKSFGNHCLTGAPFVCFVDATLRPHETDWPWEALGLLELFTDAVIVGGRICNMHGTIVEADRHWAGGHSFFSPNRGRRLEDPGYFGQVFKQRSAGSVSSQCMVVRSDFLQLALKGLPETASIFLLGDWLAMQAAAAGKRVIYSPYLGGVVERGWEQRVSLEERELFFELHHERPADRRYYPRPFSLVEGFAIDQNSHDLFYTDVCRQS